MKQNLPKILILGMIFMLLLTSCTPGTDPGATSSPEAGTDDRPAATQAPWEDYDSDDYVVSVYPKPVSITVSENETVDGSLLSPADRSFDDVFAHFGFDLSFDGSEGLPVDIKIDPSLGEEEYKLVTSKSGVTVTASGRRGVYTAVSTLRQLCKKGRIAVSEVSDKPSVPIRGVIEGFYGQAWTHAFRLDLFDFMGKYKLNAYIYAPKDDAKHRSQWRSLYTEEELKLMKELVDRATNNNVRFIYALSPGLDMKFGNGYEKDLDSLFNKCESMYDIGVRDFAILLDDIPTLDANGHAKLVNDFQNKFVKTHEGCSDLIMITTEYCDAFITSYSSEIAPLIQEDIKVMWTGASVIPDKINEKTLKRATELMGRKLFIWWNFPVNDTMPNNLFLGPCEGLGKNINEAINGLVSNPMNQGYASMLPLLTTADFLWNSEGYDKDESLESAVRKYMPKCSDALYTFADLCRATLLNGSRSSLEFSTEVKDFTKGKDGALAALKPKLEKAKADLAELRDKGDEAFLNEVSRWLTKAEYMIDAALSYIGFEEAEDTESKVTFALEFTSLYSKTVRSQAIVSNDVLMAFLDAAKTKIDAVLGEADGEAILPESVSTNMPTYLEYAPENAIDGSTSTYFWSNGAPSSGSTFTYDLGRVAEITGVKLTMGASGHTDDYIRKGVIEYSSDGSKYTKLCDLSGRVVSSDVEFTARYVRVRCTAGQTNWAIIAEFDVSRKMLVPDGTTFDGNKALDLTCLFDRSLFTGLDSKKAALGGKTLTLDVSKLSSAEFFFTETGSVTISVTDESGETKTEDVSNHTTVNLTGKTTLSVKFGGTFYLAEIILN